MSIVHAVPFELTLPPGAFGAEAVPSDVRCFLVPGASGVVLVDAGLPGSFEAIDAALTRLSTGWSDVSDVVVTHAHFDHVGGLADVLAQTPAATLRAGSAEGVALEAFAGGRQVSPLEAGDSVAGWRVVLTPGHTPGHLCLLHEGDGILLAGDAVGSVGGTLTRAPAMFTADPSTAEASLRELAALNVVRMLTSHGEELPDGPDRLADLVTPVG